MESLYITEPSTAEPKPLKIKLLETPPDKRREFVESALDSLVRSRFGSGANLSEIVDLDDLFEPEPYVEYDLTALGVFNAMPQSRRAAKTFGTHASRISAQVSCLSYFILGRNLLRLAANARRRGSTSPPRPPPRNPGVRDSERLLWDAMMLMFDL